MRLYKKDWMRSKYFIFIVVIVYFFTIQAVYKDKLGTLYQKYRYNTEIISKLKTFEKKGCNLKIDTKNATPEKLVSKAGEYLGTPHCMGGTSKTCMDCSGLLVAVFREFKIPFPHSSEEQARFGEIIAEVEKLKKGDLVFFINSYQTENLITHAGIFLGNNQFIHTSSKKGVVVTNIVGNSYWEEKFIFGSRIFIMKHDR